MITHPLSRITITVLTLTITLYLVGLTTSRASRTAAEAAPSRTADIILGQYRHEVAPGRTNWTLDFLETGRYALHMDVDIGRCQIDCGNYAIVGSNIEMDSDDKTDSFWNEYALRSDGIDPRCLLLERRDPKYNGGARVFEHVD